MIPSDLIETRTYTAPCRSCRKPTVVFMGKSHCDECVAEREANEHLVEREQRLSKLVDSGLLWPDTPKIRFGPECDPRENASVFEQARQHDGNLWLYGPAGVGKSYLARCKLTNAVLDGTRTVGEVSARRLVKTAARFDEGQGLLERWKRVRVLLLDDIDKAKWCEDSLTALWELLDERSGRGAITYVTANAAPNELANGLVSRVPHNTSLVWSTLDRLKPIKVMELTGKSRR